jgi:proline iminopeptidase
MTSCDREIYITTPGYLVPKTVDEESSLPAITLNGTKLHAESFGNPQHPIIIVLHGGPGGDYRYLLRCKQFSTQGYYVVFYDQRGAGLSRRHDKSSYTLDVNIQDLRQVIQYFRKSNDQKVFLLGHSWGAMLATSYINAYPGDIAGAILAEPGGLVWKDIKDYVGRTRDVALTSELLNDATYLDQFITGKENDHEILDYKLALLSASDGSKASPLGNEGPLPFWRYGAVVNNALFDLGEHQGVDWISNLKAFQTKVLFVYSEFNKAYGPDHALRVSGAYPQVQLFKVNGAGHDMLSFDTGWQNFYPVALTYLNALK